MNARLWTLLVALSVVWGGSFFFVEIALAAFEPLTIVFGRVSLAAVALLIFVYASGERMPMNVKAWGGFLLMGVLNNVIPFTLIVWGQTRIDSGLASILNATTPLFTIVLAHFLTTDERMTMAKTIGIVLGITGVAVLIGPGALADLGGQVLGKLAILGAALSYGFAAIFGRRLSRYPTSVAATGMLIGSTVMMAPLMFAFEHPLQAAPDAYALSAIIAIALFSTAAAYLMYFHILAWAGATNLALVTFLIPPTALGLGVVFLDEALTVNALAGLTLIGLGLAAVDGRLFRRRRSPAKP